MKAHPAAELFPQMTGEKFRGLVDAIAKRGLRDPIVTIDGKILDGRHRHRACIEAGVKPRFVEWSEDDGDPWEYVLDRNLHRRDMTASQRAMIAEGFEAHFEEAARERQGHGQTAPGRTLPANWREASESRPEESTSPNPQPAKPKHERTASADAARLLRVSPRSVERAKRVRRDGVPELAKAVERGSVAVSAASEVATLPTEEQAKVVAKGESEILKAAKAIRARKSEVRRRERVERVAAMAKPAPELPLTKRYPVLLADPPWRYRHCESESRAIENQYPTMTHAELCALDVAALGTDDCVLFLWAPSPKLAEAILLLASWGFDYKTCAVWDKGSIGPGYYFRQQHELLLVATRGELPTPEPGARKSSVIPAPRTEHSRKPDVVHALIEDMYPEYPRLEMFARRPREGWDVWGNERSQVP